MCIGEFLFKILFPATMASAAINDHWDAALAMYAGVGMMFWGVVMIERRDFKVATCFLFAWLPAVWSESVAAWCRGEAKDKE